MWNMGDTTQITPVLLLVWSKIGVVIMNEIEKAITYLKNRKSKVCQQRMHHEENLANGGSQLLKHKINDRLTEENNLYLAIQALREKLTREQNEPLTWSEVLKLQKEEVIYIVDKNSNWHSYVEVVEVTVGFFEYFHFGCECEQTAWVENYGKTWLAYRYKKEVQNAND